MRKNFVFLHGGPGLHSWAERRILQAFFSHNDSIIEFWDEPSRFRSKGLLFPPIGAFENHCKSARELVLRRFSSNGPVHLISHSFSTHTALRLVNECAAEIEKITIIGPALNMRDSFHQIFRLAIQDFEYTDIKTAEELQGILDKNPEIFDSNMRRGFEIALQDTSLFNHYWQDLNKMADWQKVLSEPGGEFDSEVFFAVLDDFGTSSIHHIPSLEVRIPVQLIFGGNDAIIFQDKEILSFKARCRKLTWQVISEAGHFPHLEKPENFVNLLFSDDRQSRPV